MRTAAVICEYNPFHNGHAYQLQFMREKLGADYIIAVMSGNFVQRGEPAAFDKYLRTKAALSCGADLVIELPPVFSSASAKEFAYAGVAAVLECGMADILCFGTEGDVTLPELYELAELTSALDAVSSSQADDRADMKRSGKPAEIKKADRGSIEGADDSSNAENIAMGADPADIKALQEKLKDMLRSGITYPEAVSRCISAFSDADTANKLELPNNILAVNYLKAIKYFRSDRKGLSYRTLTPVALPRKGSGYNDEHVTPGSFASATAIRKLLYEPLGSNCSADPFEVRSMDALGARSKNFITPFASSDYDHRLSELSALVPEQAIPLYRNSLSSIVSPDDLGCLLSMRLLDARYKGSDLTVYLDVSREIADRLLNSADRIMSFSERAAYVKTRQYTYSRISRALLHIVLGITKKEFKLRKAGGYIGYLRILGFKSSAAETGLLKALKEHAHVPVITKTADHRELLGHDLYCDQIYWSLKNKTGEYERSPVIVE